MPKIELSPDKVARVFRWVIPTIVICGAITNYAIYNLAPNPDHPIADVLKRFDLGHEPSIPAFYSASVMLLTAFFLIFVSHVDREDPKKRFSWLALSVLFFGLAIDEAVMFHEMGTAALSKINVGRAFYFSWIIPGFLFASMVGLASLRFLLTLPRRTFRWLIASGIVFVSGAIGMEFIAGIIFSNSALEEEAIRSVSHVIVQAIEEGLEMIGIAMFFTGLVDYVHQIGVVLKWERLES